MTAVGIIANPASGKDIRRLVAHGSTFDNNEKISIVRRALLGLDSCGVERVYFMPDTYAIVTRAAEGLRLRMDVTALPMVALGAQSDSLDAARRLADVPVGCLITLGGDGTNRMVAMGSGNVPFVAISTGTNNVFPRMIEGTLAGLAAGLIATGAVPRNRAVRRMPWLDVLVDGELRERALIDVVTSRQAWIGARALWDPEDLSEVVISRVTAGEIGLCSLGGLLFPAHRGIGNGVHVVIGRGGRAVLAPVAPGLIRRVPVAAATLLEPGARVLLRDEPCTLALDGEREIDIARRGHRLEVGFNLIGPAVVDVDAALQAGAECGAFVREQ